MFRRLRRLPRWKRACLAAGVATLLAAAFAPLDEERYFAAHMAQHVVIGDVAPLLVVLGLNGRLLRPLLAVRAVRALRPLAHPLVALPLWAANLALWHVPALYDAALAHEPLHALQHAFFFACGTLVWAALLEPLPGPAWFGAGPKAVYLIVMWFVSLGISQVFLWSRHPFYRHYSSLTDQRVGGGVMLLEGSLVMFGVLVWLLLRWFDEAETRQQLLDAGVDALSAARAARYGRA